MLQSQGMIDSHIDREQCPKLPTKTIGRLCVGVLNLWFVVVESEMP